MSLTAYQAKYYANELQRSYANDHVGKLAGLLFDAQVEPKPHQIDAALFALQTPYLPGILLADEVGLGKTIEAGIVITQYWAERKRRILIIAPSSLRQQWQQELYEKFLIPSQLLDPKLKDEQLARTAQHGSGVLICSTSSRFVMKPACCANGTWSSAMRLTDCATSTPGATELQKPSVASSVQHTRRYCSPRPHCRTALKSSTALSACLTPTTSTR